jgi:hypothetical protein
MLAHDRFQVVLRPSIAIPRVPFAHRIVVFSSLWAVRLEQLAVHKASIELAMKHKLSLVLLMTTVG